MTADDADSSKETSPIDRLLDLGVFAPLGFALSFRSVLPELAEAGRKQVAFSRSIGQAALRNVMGRTPTKEPADPAPASMVPVDGYQDLTAKEIVAILATCSDEDAETIEEAETAGKGRVTVLRAVAARTARDD